MNNIIDKWFSNKDLGLLIIRLALASVFIYTGWAKFANAEQMASFFASLGLNSFWFYLVAIVELVGGIAMLLGVFTRYAGILLAIIMLVAIWLTFGAVGFAGIQINLVVLASALGIAMTGAGRFAVHKS